MRLVALLLLALILVVATAMPASAARPGPIDPHSYARPDQVKVRTLALDLDVAFDRRELAGFAELALDWIDPKARTLDLDTRDLAIDRVAYADARGDWHAARFTLAARDATFGAKLSIALPAQAPKVRVYYRTMPQASGLQWLDAAQTLDKRAPFLFTQSQAIHARSWVPLQDTPAVRFTYRARIGAPAGLRAVMSANNDAAAATSAGGFRFEMPQPIPSYLLALAVGNIEFKALGARSGVYAEPGRLAAAAAEFEDTERMIETAEELFGAYRWGRYDLLVLPPSFPFGGMENPRITFATPTVIAGDKSLVALIAHELAHSWSGNLVTNAGWEHFWLNEGFTTYVENRIVEALYGADQAAMQRRIDQTELIEDLKKLDPRYKPMLPDMKGVDPDDAYSQVPYTRGAWFLRTLEDRVGRARFDEFVRGWFDAHAFQSVTTADFLAYLDANLRRELPDAMPDAELDAWLHGADQPPTAKLAETDRLAAVESARARWLERKVSAKELPTKAWTTQEWQHFLNGLPADLGSDRLAELDQAYDLTHSGNSEIAFRFYLAAIRAHYQPAREPMRKYLISIGRRKLVVPLYEELAKDPADRAWAREVFAAAEPGYHPMTRASVKAKLDAVAPAPAR